MIGRMSFNYNMSYIADILNENNALRVVFESYSSVIFEKSYPCFVEILSVGKSISINIESVGGDKICRLNIDIETRKSNIYCYDRTTDVEEHGKIDEKLRNKILKATKIMYANKTKILKIDKNLSDYKYLEFVANDGTIYRHLEDQDEYEYKTENKLKRGFRNL